MRQGVVRTVSRTLRARPGLLVFPLLTLAGWAALVAIAWLVGLSDAWARLLRHQLPTVGQDITFLLLLLLMPCVSLFTGAGLLYAVHRLAHGERPSVPAVLARTARRAPVLLRWLGVRATVGLVLRAIETSGLGDLVGAVIGFTWSLVSYFALPVLVAEDIRMLPALRRSAEIARRRSGDEMYGRNRVALIGTAMFALSVFVLIVGVRVGGHAVLPFVLVGVVVALLLTVWLMAVGYSIFRMSVYLRATAPRRARTPVPGPRAAGSDAGVAAGPGNAGA